MKYLVFAFDLFESQGGAQDCYGIADTPAEAEASGDLALTNDFSRAHIAIIDEANHRLKILAVKTNDGLGWTAPHPHLDQKPEYPTDEEALEAFRVLYHVAAEPPSSFSCELLLRSNGDVLKSLERHFKFQHPDGVIDQIERLFSNSETEKN